MKQRNPMMLLAVEKSERIRALHETELLSFDSVHKIEAVLASIMRNVSASAVPWHGDGITLESPSGWDNNGSSQYGTSTRFSS